MPLRLYDTLTRQKRDFAPIDPSSVRMYVCGPTVYDYAHIGNARPLIVFDVLFRLLRHLYGADHVTYVRNITDVDDKINDRALRDYPGLPLNDAIRKVTETTEAQFQADAAALGCLAPTHQPRATDFVTPRGDGKADMVTLIRQLIQRGHAYEAGGEVLFDVSSMPDYGALSGRKLDEQKAGARIAVDAHKKNPADFVLWKQSSADEPGWESPWGRGRPGWHIECSAMSAAYLGEVFDIHGGGLDLIFPHHENEIAQSRCAHDTPTMANIWMHNGFLQVEGQKMSKSTGNFVTIRELLEDWRGRAWAGNMVRLAMLGNHYRAPTDWSRDRLVDAESELTLVADQLSGLWANVFKNETEPFARWLSELHPPDRNFLDALCDDLNTPAALSMIRSKYGQIERNPEQAGGILSAMEILGVINRQNVFLNGFPVLRGIRDPGAVQEMFLLGRRIQISMLNGASLPSDVSNLLHTAKIKATTGVGSQLFLIRQREDVDNGKINIDTLIGARAAARARKDFKESDRIRDELAAMGVVLKDGKDADGKPVTTWEIARLHRRGSIPLPSRERVDRREAARRVRGHALLVPIASLLPRQSPSPALASFGHPLPQGERESAQRL